MVAQEHAPFRRGPLPTRLRGGHRSGLRNSHLWPLSRGRMMTFWLSFSDPADRKSLGVVIFDLDESERQLSAPEIVKKAHEPGFGGQVCIQWAGPVPDEEKNRLITDDALLLKLGRGFSQWSITLLTSPYTGSRM